MAQHAYCGCGSRRGHSSCHNKRAKTPASDGSLEMQALSDAMINVAAPASEIVKLFVNQHSLDFQQSPLAHHQCSDQCVSAALDQDTEAVLREMAKTCQQYTETIRDAFERLRLGSGGPRSPASGSDIADDGDDGAAGGEHTRTFSPNALAAMSEETRNALFKLSLPLITNPSQAGAAIQAADLAEQNANKEPAGSSLAIELHGRAMAFRSLAYGIRSGPVARSQHELGKAYLARGQYDDAARSLRSAMRARNEFELDGDQCGSREEAAYTRELYGRTMEAKGDFEEARAVRMEGLEWGRIRCGADECNVLLAAYNLSSCGSCRSVFYCSVECQTGDWVARHRRLCKKHTARRRRNERLAQTGQQPVGSPHPKERQPQPARPAQPAPQPAHQEDHVSQPHATEPLPEPPVRKGKRKNLSQ